MYIHYLVFTDNDYTGVVYVPTIVNACVYRAGDSFRLNVRWKVCIYVYVYFVCIEIMYS